MAATARLLSCPYEILKQIAVLTVDLKSVQSLRLACKRLSRIGNDLLFVLTPLIVNFTPESVSRLEGICKNLSMVRSIRHIVVNTYILKDLDKRREICFESARWMLEDDEEADEWPQSLPNLSERYLTAVDNQREILRCGTLTEGLKRLLDRVIKIESFQMKSVDSVSNIRKWASLVHRLHPNSFLQKKTIKADVHLSTIAAWNCLFALHESARYTDMQALLFNGAPEKVVCLGMIKAIVLPLGDALHAMCDRLEELTLDFRESPRLEFRSWSTSAILGDTVFPRLHKLSMFHVWIDNEDMDYILSLNTQLTSLLCGFLYFNINNTRAHIEFMRNCVCKNLKLKDFSLSGADTATCTTHPGYVVWLNRPCYRTDQVVHVPALGGREPVQIKLKYLYRNLICGHPYSIASRSDKYACSRVDWQSVNTWDKVESYDPLSV